MTTFIAKIKTPNNGLLEFYFASIETVHGQKFFITTIDKDTRSHLFYMKRIDEAWRIDRSAHPIQNWILDLEPDLDKLIQQKRLKQ